MNTKLRGSWGEASAMKYLRDRQYIPVAMGYRSRYGEIDLIVRDGRYIVFVEVKLRKNSSFAEAREFVDRNKQERLRKTAALWLCANETPLQPRFDVIEIYAPQGAITENPVINHLINAFE
ncbi:YraN family protein [Oscillospiraceae bacterium CM]|nr:YraN family protein [Oscillospiraceae bacterium CM]